MKPIVRYRSQLLYRRSYKPLRVRRVRPGSIRLSFRPQTHRCHPRLDRDLAFLISY